jgi:DNA polymerase-1
VASHERAAENPGSPAERSREAGTGSDELFLIDGNSLAYRAFFALPESIATSDGRPTNAIFGFASMLVKILSDFRPAAVIVAWDAGWSGRETTYDQYKAQRKSRPDLLKDQWPHLAPLVEAFGYSNVRVEGYEADDVIAALARQAREHDIPVMVVSGDRDAYQLVQDGVRVMTTSRGVTDTRIYDRDGVVERYGIPPELIPDFIGLKGDTSDNIPGVPGIGDKTAAQLLQEFGSLETVLESVDKISGAKRKQNLTEHAEDARVSKQLATLVFDVETGIDVRECFGVEPDRSRLREVFREFELRDPLRRLEEALGVTEVPAAPAETELTAKPVASIAELRPGPVAVASADGRWAATDGTGLAEGEASDPSVLAAAIGDRPVVAHDLKALGGPRGGLLAVAPQTPVEWDTIVAAYVIDPARRKYELAELAQDAGLSVEGGNGADPAEVQLEIGQEAPSEGPPPAEAALLVAELAHRQRGPIADLGLERLLREVELPLIEVLAAMEATGVKFDLERLAEIAEGVEETISTLQAETWELAGREFTLGSPQQLSEVLFNELGLSRKRRGKTGFSTDARVLAAIRSEHPIVEKIERWRETSKLKNTYLDALPGLVDPETGRIHTTFNQVATTTGRLSSINPNLQNIPIRSELGRPLRSCFVAEKGSLLLSADYNQVELRVLAHVAGEDVLREIFRSGEDIHAATASEVLGIESDAIGFAERSKAKMVNFGIAYGLSAFGLADRLQIEQDEAAAYTARYFERFPAVKRFIDETIASATTEGHVTTLMGRRRAIPELHASQRQTRLLGERLAVNTVIQGTAADIIKLAMVRCQRALTDAGLETRLVLQIHDELLFEAPEKEVEDAKKIVRREMCRAFDLDPPLEVDVGIGPDWLAAK